MTMIFFQHESFKLVKWKLTWSVRTVLCSKTLIRGILWENHKAQRRVGTSFLHACLSTCLTVMRWTKHSTLVSCNLCLHLRARTLLLSFVLGWFLKRRVNHSAIDSEKESSSEKLIRQDWHKFCSKISPIEIRYLKIDLSRLILVRVLRLYQFRTCRPIVEWKKFF